MPAKTDSTTLMAADTTGFLKQLNALLNDREAMTRREAILHARRVILKESDKEGAKEAAGKVGPEFIYEGSGSGKKTIRTSVPKDRAETLARGNVKPKDAEIDKMAMDFGLQEEQKRVFITAGKAYIENHTAEVTAPLPPTVEQSVPPAGDEKYSSELHRQLQSILRSRTFIRAPATIVRPGDAVQKGSNPRKLSQANLREYFGIGYESTALSLLQGSRPCVEKTLSEPKQNKPSNAENEYTALGQLLGVLKATPEEKDKAYAAHKQWLIDNHASDEIMPAAYREAKAIIPEPTTDVAAGGSEPGGWSAGVQAGAVRPNVDKKGPASRTR